MHNLTYGCDPEYFVTHAGSIVPPMALIDDFNFPYEERGDKVILYEKGGLKMTMDGSAVEINTEPYTDHTRIQTDIKGFLKEYQSYLYTHCRSQFTLRTHDLQGKLDLSKYWEGRGDKFKSVVAIGCDPDINPYIQMGLEEPSSHVSLETVTDRFCGGHLQVACPPDEPYIFHENWFEMSILMDFIIGLTNVSINRTLTTKNQELNITKQYGKPGRVRLQVYPGSIAGIEYRTPSNYHYSSTINLFKHLEVVCRVVLKGLHDKFIDDFENDLVDMYNIMVSFNKRESRKLFSKVISWLLNEDVIKFTEVNRLCY